jgi:hypothetical protein
VTGQPNERDVDHDEVQRRDERDVTPVDPAKKNIFAPMNILMVAVVVLGGLWFLFTQLG